MSRGFSFLSLGMLALVVVLAASPAQAARFNIAVFNFQMTSDTPEWVWLEKGLADQITTDFTGSRNIIVVARDEMQMLARKYSFTPEMAHADASKMEKIRQQLKIDYLITGLVCIDGENVTITAQIVKVSDRKEVTRKIITGKVGDVLNSRKRFRRNC